jgi:hypothetical protein
MRMGMRKHTINMGNARINMRKIHMIGLVRHEIIYRRGGGKSFKKKHAFNMIGEKHFKFPPYKIPHQHHHEVLNCWPS